MRQTVRCFEWLIIDDGSTDDPKELIDEYKKTADFPIRFYRKENGGKHTAWNMALGLISTNYFICLDSDDAILDNAIERMLYYWDSIDEKKRDDYWCVVGLSMDPITGEVVGDKFPEGINESDDPAREARNVGGDKFGCHSLKAVKQFPFPEPEGTTFITESIVWDKIDRYYRQYYVNDVFRYYYIESNSLTQSWYREHVKEGYVSNYFWKQSKINNVGIQNLSDLKTAFQLPYYGFMSGKKTGEILKGIEIKKYRPLVLMMTPAAFVLKKTRGKKYIEE